ncbi:MAG: hypothetical protein WCL00_04220 [Bacteroidota bacterium]
MVKRCKWGILIIATWFLSFNSFPQEMLGIMNSNFTGVLNGLINPANPGNSAQYINVNILAGDQFISSNYIYIHKKDYGFLKIFKININDPNFLYIYDFPATNYKDSVNYFDYFKNSKPRNLYTNTRIVGPSVMVRKGRHTFSFLTEFRSNTSVVGISPDLANFLYRGMQFRPQQTNDYSAGPFSFTSLTWAEIGLGYANTLHKDYDYALTAGISGKFLLGVAGAYGLVKNISYMIPNIDSIYFYKFNGEIGMSLPIDIANNTTAINPLFKGKGVSFDIGVTYMKFNQLADKNKKMPEWLEGDKHNYLYKAGISLIDFGFIRFNKMVQVNQYNNVSNALWKGLRSFNPTNIQQIFTAASYNLLGDSLASRTSQSQMTIWLPAAISGQFDYNFGNNFYLDATIVQGLPVARVQVRRPSLLAVTPRYETRYFEVNMPFSFYDYRDPQIGLAIRIFNLVIGTEKLGTFLNLTDVNGMDVYFSLGFNLLPSAKSSTAHCDSYENYQRYQQKKK